MQEEEHKYGCWCLVCQYLSLNKEEGYKQIKIPLQAANEQLALTEGQEKYEQMCSGLEKVLEKQRKTWANPPKSRLEIIPAEPFVIYFYDDNTASTLPRIPVYSEPNRVNKC
ncbi:MAG: hypothetical protein WCG84_04560 [Candidatus Moraniibacteriota bacterium]